MRLGQCSITNFGSYSSLEFDYSSQGLAILHGPTGCGKSTLLDIPLWILYGQTTKQCTSDQIISWTTSGPTAGTICVDVGSGGTITVTRSRKPNDLFWVEQGSIGCEIRGKDLTETQKLLTKRLGVDFEGFVASCCYHEFSPAATFFTDKAKDRREFFERMANLELPSRVIAGASVRRKQLRLSGDSAKIELSRLDGQLRQVQRNHEKLQAQARTWDLTQEAKIKEIKCLCKNFQAEKEKKIQDLQKRSRAWDDNHQQVLEALADKALDLDEQIRPDDDFEVLLSRLEQSAHRCPECNEPNREAAERREAILKEQADNARRKDRLAAVKAQYAKESTAVSPYTAALTLTEKAENTYGHALEEALAKTNPHIVDEMELIKLTEGALAAKVSMVKTEADIDNLDQLTDLSKELKSQLLHSTVKEIEADTNSLLSGHFDGEFQVTLTVAEDNLDVLIVKDSHECVFRQLSKGQKQLLRLCFSVASMKVAAARTGVTPQTLFFDEPTDGLDPPLKLKALGVFRHIPASAVLVVEHSPEVQNAFDSKISVRLTGEGSELTYG